MSEIIYDPVIYDAVCYEDLRGWEGGRFSTGRVVFNESLEAETASNLEEFLNAFV